MNRQEKVRIRKKGKKRRKKERKKERNVFVYTD
jgi:hypothetical protein